jgi:hypothetical protein
VRRVLPLMLTIAYVAVFGGGVARAEQWHSEQPVAAGTGVPTTLGEIGDVEFWAPNRGVLITAGTSGTPAGIYAYDGTGWHLYSTVCGGHQGRIAWAGPDDFWTISDQQKGQGAAEGEARKRVSLCHFENGAVVASYGEPLGLPTSYLQMNAAACSGPDDCWFAGERLPGTLNIGAFHLHWNGSEMRAIPSLTEVEPEMEDPGRAVGALAYWEGVPYESVRVRQGDEAPNESVSQPSLLHRIAPGAPSPFVPITATAPIAFGSGEEPGGLETLHLSAGGGRLWGVAGVESGNGEPVVLQLDAGGLHQLKLEDPTGALGPEAGVTGLAAEPGSGSAWVSLAHENKNESPTPARLARIEGNGRVLPAISLPAPGEGLSVKGAAGPVACPAAEQCWMATKEGWLFHLGSSLPQDTDPAMHTLIGFRPPDDSVPLPPPADLPLDDSGAEQQKKEAPLPNVHFPEPKQRKKLVTGVKQRVVHKSVLLLTFRLRARAHVQLIAKLHKHVVAKTPAQILGKGPHKLQLRLNPKRWPDDLNFEVHAARGSNGSGS